MGCWNHTCAVTNLPILWKEEVEVILLKDNTDYDGVGSACYPYATYTPVPLTFSGTYNDYGAVENCEGATLDIIIAAIRNVLHEEPPDEEARYDKGVSKEGFDVEMLFELNHGDKLYIQNPMCISPDSPKICRVTPIVVRKDVYEGIVTKTRVGRWWDDDEYTIHAKLDTDVFTKDLDEFNALGADDEEALIRKMLMRMHRIGESETAELISYEGVGAYGMNRPLNVIDELIKLREIKSELYEAVLENATRFAFFNQFMYKARKSYTIPSGRGSQDDSTRHQELCAKLTLSSAKAQRKWRGEQYEE